MSGNLEATCFESKRVNLQAVAERLVVGQHHVPAEEIKLWAFSRMASLGDAPCALATGALVIVGLGNIEEHLEDLT